MKLRRSGNTPPPAPASTSSAEYSEPNRNWTRVGVLAGGWALVLGLGAWVGPGIVEGGAGTDSVLDEAPGSPRSAAYRYLSYSLDRNDIEPAENAICDDEVPELSPSQLHDMRTDLQGDGPRPQFGTSLQDESSEGESTLINYEVELIFSGRVEVLDLELTIRPDGDGYCVADVQQLNEVPGNSDGSDEEDNSIEAGEEIAALFLSAIFQENDIETASNYLCSDYEGPDPEVVRAFFDDWSGDDIRARTGQSFVDDGEEISEGSKFSMDSEFIGSGPDTNLRFEFTVINGCIDSIEDIPELEDFIDENNETEDDSEDSEDNETEDD